jgi:hypothetical protein
MRIAITVCIDYSDFLSITLPNNRAMFDMFVIVTEETDADTIRIAEAHNCFLIITNLKHAFGAQFNKSAMIVSAQKYLHETYPEAWMCILDADIVLPHMFQNTEFTTLDKSSMYGLRRYDFETKEDWLQAKNCKEYPLFDTSSIYGYFQLYYDKTKFYPETSKDCRDCDTIFQSLFATKRELSTEYAVAHLGFPAINWNGRVTERWD